jgi:hypothetical protein
MVTGIESKNILVFTAMRKSPKQLSVKILVMYMIMALLFLASVELHIHTAESASTADHGSAVSISSFTDDLMAEGSGDEINVSPDGVMKVKQDDISVFAVFLLVAVMLAVLCPTFIGRLRGSHALLPLAPFYGAPSLRAPPL